MNGTNYIIAEFYVKGKSRIKIIDSSDGNQWDYDYNIKNSNEKEIKECEISINGEIIPFTYYYNFNQEGKYTIKYSFPNKITNMKCLFYECYSLINIDLSNFNSENVKDMSYMFCECYSLENINLSNLNMKNVINMQKCLKDVDL